MTCAKPQDLQTARNESFLALPAMHLLCMCSMLRPKLKFSHLSKTIREKIAFLQDCSLEISDNGFPTYGFEVCTVSRHRTAVVPVFDIWGFTDDLAGELNVSELPRHRPIICVPKLRLTEFKGQNSAEFAIDYNISVSSLLRNRKLSNTSIPPVS